MPATLLFDVMSTLVHDPFHETMPRFFGLDLQELIRQKDPTAWLEFERGERREADFFRVFFRDRRPIDGPGLVKAMREAYVLLPGAAALLDDLRARGARLHLCSNYSDWYRHIEAATGLGRWASWTFVSCDHRTRKPERLAYARTLEAAGVPASEAIFVDDQPLNVEAARRYGLDGILFESIPVLRSALEQRGVL